MKGKLKIIIIHLLHQLKLHQESAILADYNFSNYKEEDECFQKAIKIILENIPKTYIGKYKERLNEMLCLAYEEETIASAQ